MDYYCVVLAGVHNHSVIFSSGYRTAYQISKPYVFSLVFALMSRNKGNFLCFAHNPIQEPCGSSFHFSGRVGINVHCGTDIRVSEKFLHIFGLCTT